MINPVRTPVNVRDRNDLQAVQCRVPILDRDGLRVYYEPVRFDEVRIREQPGKDREEADDGDENSALDILSPREVLSPAFVDEFCDIVADLDLFRIPRLHPRVDHDWGGISDVIVFQFDPFS